VRSVEASCAGGEEGGLKKVGREMKTKSSPASVIRRISSAITKGVSITSCLLSFAAGLWFGAISIGDIEREAFERRAVASGVGTYVFDGEKTRFEFVTTRGVK